MSDYIDDMVKPFLFDPDDMPLGSCVNDRITDAASAVAAAAERNATRALDSVSGALVDAGDVPVPDDEFKYGDAVRVVVRQRDEALDGLKRALGLLESQCRDPEAMLRDCGDDAEPARTIMDIRKVLKDGAGT